MNGSLVRSNRLCIRTAPGGQERKSPLMLACVLVLWGGAVLYFGPRLWTMLAGGATLAEMLLLLAYCGMLVLFWLMAAYHIAVVLFATLERKVSAPANLSDGRWPAVAVLYPTCNDFQREAVASCLGQNYPSFHLFLLDDSTRPEYRAMVDDFHAAHPHVTTIVRRPDRRGFKAGNLNHALHGPAADYPYFAVVDADERLPADFLRRAVPHMRDSTLAFVQANHAPNPKQEEPFARDIAKTILPFWDVHCRLRNRYGLVVFVGHGALVRHSAWETVGGFPEIITEDLAFTAMLAQRGLRGRFLADLLCYEDFPATYTAFKRQQERYVIGTTQVLRTHLWPTLGSRNATLAEKLDLLLWCLPLYVPALCLLFVVLCSLALPLVFGSWSDVTVSVLGHAWTLPGLRILDRRFVPLWLMDFQVYSVVVSLAPALAALTLGIRGKLSAIRLLSFSAVAYLSLMVVSWRGILGYLLAGRTLWPPTGDDSLQCQSLPLAQSSPTIRARAAWRSPRLWELSLGAVLAVASMLSLNVALFAVSCCLLIGPWIELAGWESKPARVASVMCFVLIIFQLILSVLLVSGTAGSIPLVFSVHF